MKIEQKVWEVTKERKKTMSFDELAKVAGNSKKSILNAKRRAKMGSKGVFMSKKKNDSVESILDELGVGNSGVYLQQCYLILSDMF